VSADDPNFPSAVSADGSESGYRILIEQSQTEIVEKLKELKAAIERGDLKAWEFRGIHTVVFEQHLYRPLHFLQGNVVEIYPTPLNRGELRFIEDMTKFYDSNAAAFAGRELYLLRNLSRGRGVGFFEAGNFHPDFIVWQLQEERQRIAFVDPKGIRNVGLKDPKISFFETVKEIEHLLANPNVVLESFIVSSTPSHVMRKQWGIEKDEMSKRHIVFQEEDNPAYIGAILQDTSGTAT
jgi:hypothetical protein